MGPEFITSEIDKERQQRESPANENLVARIRDRNGQAALEDLVFFAQPGDFLEHCKGLPVERVCAFMNNRDLQQNAIIDCYSIFLAWLQLTRIGVIVYGFEEYKRVYISCVCYICTSFDTIQFSTISRYITTIKSLCRIESNSTSHSTTS